MKKIVKDIEKLKKNKISKTVKQRIKEFKGIDRRDNDIVFKELCFCILTANYQAEKSIKIQATLGDDFLKLPPSKLTPKLKRMGHRFPKTRAEYIAFSRKNKKELAIALRILDGEHLREWVVKHMKGLGYKEASHFLRNIGYDDYAIVDFHIIDLLVKHKLVKKPKTISKAKYLEIEEVLSKIGDKTNLTLAELDLYLWYMETGKVLK